MASKNASVDYQSATQPGPAPNPSLWPYALEKLGAAVTVLATHPEDVRRRLYFAYEHFAMVPSNALPDNLRKQYEDISERLLRRESPTGLSRLNFNLRRMRKATASKIAAQIVRLYSELEYILDYKTHQ